MRGFLICVSGVLLGVGIVAIRRNRSQFQPQARAWWAGGVQPRGGVHTRGEHLSASARASDRALSLGLSRVRSSSPTMSNPAVVSSVLPRG